MLLPLGALLLAHVPGYGDNCEFGCCHVPHPTRLDVSQAVYLKGTAGIEIDLVDIQDYIDESKDIEFSVVFKEEYDVWTYDLFVGCGGCASHRTLDNYHGWDPLNYSTNLLPKPTTYQPGVLEAFTQHAYFPLLPKGQARMFNAGQLKDCDSDHFSIRLVTYDNASHDLTYSIALGCEDGIECEEFNFMELFLFPVYVIRNHGTHWNNAAYTLPIIGIVVTVLYGIVFYVLFHRSFLGVYQPVSILPPQFVYEELHKRGETRRFYELPCVIWRPSVRAVIYAVVMLFLLIDLFETVTHAFIASHALNNASQPYEGRGLGIFIGVVLIFGKITPIVLVGLIWRFHRAIPEFVWRNYKFKCAWNKYHGLGWYSPMWAHGGWSIVEILFLGFLGFIWLGAGYWIFPFGMLIAGITRLSIWINNPDGYVDGVQHEEMMPSIHPWDKNQNACSDEVYQQLYAKWNQYAHPLAEDQPLLEQEAINVTMTTGAHPSAPSRLSATRPLSRSELAQLGRR
jgi:hypothetical protein